MKFTTKNISGNYFLDILESNNIIVHTIMLNKQKKIMLALDKKGTYIIFLNFMVSSSDFTQNVDRIKSWKKNHNLKFKGLDFPNEEIFVLFLLEFA